MPFGQHDNEFEHWLREQTEQHRLFAEESVWNRIQQRLSRRRWLPVALSLLLITSGAVSWVMMNNPSRPTNKWASIAPSTELQPNHNQSQPTVPNIPDKAIIPFNKKTRIETGRSEHLSFLDWTRTNSYTTEKIESAADDQPSEIQNTADDSVESTADQFGSAAKKNTDQVRSLPIKKPIIEPSSQTTVSQNQSIRQTTSSKNTPSSSELNNITPEQMQTIESVVNTYKGKRTSKSWKLTFSISPTVSYRKLIEDTDALQAARSVMNAAPAMAVPEFESVVKHKPDMGLQVGVSVQRQLTDRIAFIGGLQFNINKYDIRAYTGNREVATVGLSNGGSVSSYTNYRSSGGTWANWLANFYFSASAPIGFQVRLAGNKKWNWGVSSTLQPTCILSNQTYLLSTDYKNYLEVPSLVRRWNLNGQAETFIGFQGKKTRYTLGPQARYQILSSFEKAYPVQEHLFDIGIKLGVGL
jgi:hypothetical protein